MWPFWQNNSPPVLDIVAKAHWLFVDIHLLHLRALAALDLCQLVRLSVHLLKYHKQHFLFCLKIIAANNVMEPNNVIQANSCEKRHTGYYPIQSMTQKWE